MRLFIHVYFRKKLEKKYLLNEIMIIMPRFNRVKKSLPIIIAFLLFFYFFINKSSQPTKNELLDFYEKIQTKKEISTKNSMSNNGNSDTETKSQEQSCQFPKLTPDDPAMQHFFKKTYPLKCSKEKNWVYVRNGTFFIDPHALERHGPIECSYKPFWRLTDSKTASMNVARFPSGSKLQHDFFTVKCRSKKNININYSNVHAGVVPSEKALRRAQEKKLPPKALGLNVYMLGLDSISRMTFIRKLPKTYEFITKNMAGIVLEGYNIVGDGTPQALIPILTGKTELELPLTRRRYANASYVDVYPFVWNEFMDAGYSTLYGEDCSNIGTFSYRLKGFDKQPTDHYMRTFYTEAEKLKPPIRFCWGSEPHHKVHFGYVEQFWETYPPEIRKFAFQFHSVLSHDDINDIGKADHDMLQHLRFFVDNGYWNDTILIFMSDHGHRFTSLRETQQGKLEELLPFFSFIFPPWFSTKYPESMQTFKRNAQLLTTPFDIHATLRSILHFDPKTKLADNSKKNRSLSLFHEIPIERTCSDADIEPHWCSCLAWSEIPVFDPTIQKIAYSLIDRINSETERDRKLCAELSLLKIDRALKYVPNTAVLSYKMAKDKDGFVPDLSGNGTARIEYYQLNFWTTPGHAHYEASVTFNKIDDDIRIDLKTVSHVNAFGDKPHCVIDMDYFLAKWCICRDKI